MSKTSNTRSKTTLTPHSDREYSQLLRRMARVYIRDMLHDLNELRVNALCEKENRHRIVGMEMSLKAFLGAFRAVLTDKERGLVKGYKPLMNIPLVRD